MISEVSFLYVIGDINKVCFYFRKNIDRRREKFGYESVRKSQMIATPQQLNCFSLIWMTVYCAISVPQNSAILYKILKIYEKQN